MLPSHSNLNTLVGKPFSLDPKLTATGGADGVTERADICSLTNAGLTLASAGSDTGFWVPYITSRLCVGYAAGAKAWMASGPFSGCEFAVGRRGTDGKMFAAHIAKESGSTAGADWVAYLKKNDLQIWYQNKIPLPDPGAYSGSYVFASCEGNALTSLVRIDLRTKGMGGSDGEVFNVKVFK